MDKKVRNWRWGFFQKLRNSEVGLFKCTWVGISFKITLKYKLQQCQFNIFNGIITVTIPIHFDNKISRLMQSSFHMQPILYYICFYYITSMGAHRISRDKELQQYVFIWLEIQKVKDLYIYNPHEE